MVVHIMHDKIDHDIMYYKKNSGETLSSLNREYGNRSTGRADQVLLRTFYGRRN